jgi:hypothetical protein
MYKFLIGMVALLVVLAAVPVAPSGDGLYGNGLQVDQLGCSATSAIPGAGRRQP